MPYHIQTHTKLYEYANLSDFLTHIVDSLYPFDPSDDSDVQVFLNEVLKNEHSDITLARYELKERRCNAALNMVDILDKTSNKKRHLFKSINPAWSIWKS
jgi:hypothetical protein